MTIAPSVVFTVQIFTNDETSANSSFSSHPTTNLLTFLYMYFDFAFFQNSLSKQSGFNATFAEYHLSKSQTLSHQCQKDGNDAKVVSIMSMHFRLLSDAFVLLNRHQSCYFSTDSYCQSGIAASGLSLCFAKITIVRLTIAAVFVT